MRLGPAGPGHHSFVLDRWTAVAGAVAAGVWDLRPGTQATDLDRYLAEFRAGGYPVDRVVHATCAGCGGSTFTCW